nr:hypothetical protein [Tanacetum cinerariifolium]
MEVALQGGKGFWRVRSLVSAVTGQVTYTVASLTLDSARSYVMHGAFFTQRTIYSIPISISPEGFEPFILLLVVIIVTVVIVVVILVVVVVAIVEVVIVVAMIGVVVVVGGGVSSILKLSFMIIDTMKILEFKTSKDRYEDNRMSDSIGGLVFLVTKVGESWMSSGGVIDLTDDEDPTDEDGDTGMDDLTGVSVSLGGEISSGGKKSQESNSDNIGGTTVGEAIGACS